MSKTINKTAIPLWSNLPSNIIYAITDFFTLQELDYIATACKCSKCLISKIASLGSIKIFTSKYLNKTQRSIYMEIYSKPQVMELEKKHIEKLHLSSKDSFMNFYNSFQTIFKKMNLQFVSYENIAQFISNLQSIIFDPQLPAPKIRRKSIGAFCNSPLQFYLVDTQFGIAEPFLYQIFSEFLLYLSSLSNTASEELKRQFTDFPQIREKLSQILYTPEIITSKNYLSYLIPNDCETNFIVMLYAITSNVVDSIFHYVKQFHDPIQLFLELVLRYSIFRNFVLEIEQKFKSLFVNYGEKLKEMFKQKMEYDYCFWRPALSIWYSAMKPLHEKTNKVQIYLLAKKRIQNLKGKINENKDKYNCQGSLFINQLNNSSYLLLLKEQIYTLQNQFNGKQSKLQQNSDLLDQVITEYLEYMVDLSVNELTVHWCGHSEQVLDETYEQFQDIFFYYNEEYVEYIKNLVLRYERKAHKSQILRDLLSQDIHLLQQGYLKPVTVCKIIEYYNQTVLQVSKLQNSPNQEKPLSMTQSNQKNEGINLKKISSSTQSNDKLIEYFNTKNLPSKYQNHQLSLSEQLTNSLKIRSISSSNQSKILLRTTEIRNQYSILKENTIFPQICQCIGSQVEELVFKDEI